MNIQVSNLHQNTIDNDLRKLFSAFGEVNTAVILRDKLNGRSKCSAIIDMVNDTQASKAILVLNKSTFEGKVISVSEIKYSVRDYMN
jgi:RNA recognition motif-containing protein